MLKISPFYLEKQKSCIPKNIMIQAVVPKQAKRVSTDGALLSQFSLKVLIIGTGPDFQFVLENSAKASEHLQLKAEKEWETKHQEFNNDFFALNLNSLESKIDCIPLYKVLQIEKEELEDVGLISVFYPYIHDLCIY